LTIFHGSPLDANKKDVLNLLYTDCTSKFHKVHAQEEEKTSLHPTTSRYRDSDNAGSSSSSSSSTDSPEPQTYILPLICSTLNRLGQEETFSSCKYSFLVDASMHLAIQLLLSPIHYPNYPPLEFISNENDDNDHHRELLLPIQMLLESTKIYIMDLLDEILIPSKSKQTQQQRQQQLIMMILSCAESTGSYHSLNSVGKGKDSMSEEEDDFLDRFPVGIREIFLGKNTNDSTKRVEKRHWHDVQTSSLIVLIELIQRYRFVLGMETVRQRLEQYAGSMWYDESNQENCRDMGDKGEIIDLYCNAYVEYLEVSSDNCCWNGADAVGFVMRLIQSFWDVDTVKKGITMVGRDGSLVVGLILARYLIQSDKVSEQGRSMMSDLITRILLSHDEASGSHVDAVIGYWGLAFFCSLCSESGALVSFPNRKEAYLMKLDQKIRNSFKLPVSDVFDRIKMLLVMRLGLIQLENEFVSRDRPSYHLHSTLPKWIESRRKVTNRRVLCCASLVSKLHCEDQLSIRQLKEWFTFVGCLTEMYLRAGSFLAGEKWNPEIWLLSSTEVLSSPNGEAKGISSYYRLGVGKGWHETMNHRAFKHISTRVMLQNAYTFALSIAMHRTVLNHVVGCFRNDAAESKIKSSDLIRFQLAKIYDLSFRFRQCIEFILETTVSFNIINFVSFFNLCLGLLTCNGSGRFHYI
jgi:hypothetical protein